jgi:peptidoglycan/LPS O-acetylase OafA/YrhL
LRYPNFDLLRLLLAVEVAVVHAWYETDPKFDWPGFIMAVPAFLAISGVLVLKSYDETGSWRLFVVKRLLRILPALAVSMLLCWALFDLFAVGNSMLNWLTGGIFTLPGVANGPLWSLAWEELAYALLAVLWTCGAYRRPWIIWSLLAAAFLGVHLGKGLRPHDQMILMLAPAFFIGNLAYLHRRILLKTPSLVPWAFLFAVICADSLPWFRDLVRLSPVAFQSFAVVWVGMAGACAAPFRFPDLSYGIYIFHMPLILYLVRSKLVTTTAEIALVLPLPLLAIAMLSWRFVEEPALRRKPKARAPEVGAPVAGV